MIDKGTGVAPRLLIHRLHDDVKHIMAWSGRKRADRRRQAKPSRDPLLKVCSMKYLFGTTRIAYVLIQGQRNLYTKVSEGLHARLPDNHDRVSQDDSGIPPTNGLRHMIS